MDAVQEGLDTLQDLEQRITRAIEVVSSLRSDNEQLRTQIKSVQDELGATKAERDDALALSAEFQKDNTDLTAQIKKLSEDVEELRGERKQVKARIEKLLGQMDLLSAS